MNILIANKKQALMDQLDVDILERISGEFLVEELAKKYKNTFFNRMVVDITAIKDYENINSIQALALAFPTDKLILVLDDSLKVNSPLYLSQLVSMGIFNFTKDVSEVPYLINNPNSYKDVARYQMLDMTQEEIKNNQEAYDKMNDIKSQRVLGVFNKTPHAGATTLTYILTKHLQKQYKVHGVELGKNDLQYFKDEAVSAIGQEELMIYISEHPEFDVIVVDLDENKDSIAFCTDVLYLIEPGKIQLNRLLEEDKDVFDKLYQKKIILNRSVLGFKDVEDFERESHTRVYYNIPNIDDKQSDIKIINAFLAELGFTKFSASKNTFSIFK